MKKQETLKNERNKAVSQYTSLENKKEQIGLLINQLQNLASIKQIGPLSFLDNDGTTQLDYLRPANKIISAELARAIEDQENLTKDIKQLKDKIQILNQRIKL